MGIYSPLFNGRLDLSLKYETEVIFFFEELELYGCELPLVDYYLILGLSMEDSWRVN